MIQLANLVKSGRLRLGMSQSDLAERASVSLPTIQNIEADKANPSLSTTTSILAELGIELTLARRLPNWDVLSTLGLDALAGRWSSQEIGEVDLRRQMQLALLALVHDRADLEFWQRREQAVAALLMALQQHFPSFYRAYCAKVPVVTEFLEALPEDFEVRVSAATLRRLGEIL